MQLIYLQKLFEKLIQKWMLNEQCCFRTPFISAMLRVRFVCVGNSDHNKWFEQARGLFSCVPPSDPLNLLITDKVTAEHHLFSLTCKRRVILLETFFYFQNKSSSSFLKQMQGQGYIILKKINLLELLYKKTFMHEDRLHQWVESCPQKSHESDMGGSVNWSD